MIIFGVQNIQKNTKKVTFDKNGVYQCYCWICYFEYYNDNPQSFLMDNLETGTLSSIPHVGDKRDMFG